MKLPPYLDPSGSDWVQAPTKSCRRECGKVTMTDGMAKEKNSRALPAGCNRSRMQGGLL